MTATVLAAGLTFILGIATNWWTTRRALVMRYDADLRRERLQAYVKLWAHLEALNKYGSRAPDLARYEAGKLADALTHWYFSVGGIYLSVPARQDYFALQDALQQFLATETIKEAEREFVRVKASRLRTSITRDVGTRMPLKLRGDRSPRPGKDLFGTFHGGDGREITISRPWYRFGRGVHVGHTDALEDVGWVSDAWTISAKHDGKKREFLLDSRGLIEGPVGWKPDDKQGPPRIWERR
jgi:hypothetical protein